MFIRETQETTNTVVRLHDFSLDVSNEFSFSCLVKDPHVKNISSLLSRSSSWRTKGEEVVPLGVMILQSTLSARQARQAANGPASVQAALPESL